MITYITQKAKRFISGLVSNSAPEHQTQVQQIGLANQYRLMKKLCTPAEMPSMQDVGFKVYSQFEEDGLLLYIFSVIGTSNKRVVEICAGDGIQCMAANLIINHGWSGLLFDGDEELVERGRKFFASHQSTWLHPPVFKAAWITRENIDQLIIENGFNGGVDLLSLDIDGNDYYIMEAITCIKPRVIICETQNVIPVNLALTIPYEPDFDRLKNLHPDFTGASLLAMVRLLKKRGYRLVGSHRFGFNAIFVLDGVGADYFKEVSVESVHDNAYTKHRISTNWQIVKDLPWVEV